VLADHVDPVLLAAELAHFPEFLAILLSCLLKPRRGSRALLLGPREARISLCIQSEIRAERAPSRDAQTVPLTAANDLKFRYTMVMLAKRLADHDDTPVEDKIREYRAALVARRG
jgi:hypothetical protein